MICSKDFFSNIDDVIEENNNFSVIGCQYLHDRVFMPAGFFDEKKYKKFLANFRNDKGNLVFVYNTKKYGIPCERRFEIDPNSIVIGFVSNGCF